jgi:hypothetical protein
MNTGTRNTILRIAITIVCSILLGLLVFGKYILIPNNTGFYYTIYGISAILFYYYRIKSSTKNYILLGTLYSILMIIIFQRSSHLLVLSRNFCWFLLIGLLSNYHAMAEKEEWYVKSKAWIITIWLAGFICVYAVMTFLNIFVYSYYPLNDRMTILLYFKQIVKIGGVLGFGIGLGQFLSGYFIREKHED